MRAKIPHPFESSHGVELRSLSRTLQMRERHGLALGHSMHVGVGAEEVLDTLGGERTFYFVDFRHFSRLLDRKEGHYVDSMFGSQRNDSAGIARRPPTRRRTFPFSESTRSRRS